MVALTVLCGCIALLLGLAALTPIRPPNPMLTDRMRQAEKASGRLMMLAALVMAGVVGNLL